MPEQLHLAVALDDSGWHPAAWREPAARPTDLFTAGYWTDLVQTAERGLLHFVTIEDSLGLQDRHLRRSRRSGRPGARPAGRGARRPRVAPVTHSIGLLPTAVVTHTEPFHLSKAIATLDYVSQGRAGVRVKVSASGAEAHHFGRRHIPQYRPADLATPEVQQLVSDLFDEAADYVEVVRRLWDSWEDDAEIRDAATGRFIDRNKLHYVDFHSKHLSVKGPSIVPRPPQGQPLVSALAHIDLSYRLAARQVDIVYVTPPDVTDAAAIVHEVRTEQATAGRQRETLHVFADLVVFLDADSESGAARKARLNELDGAEYTSDARIFTGSAAELADLLGQYQQAGIAGFRLRPGALPDDLTRITAALVPELQRRNLFRRSYPAPTLRGLLGLARPANRYAVTEGVPA